eukprot:CAMPEP_0182420692 /NCGR_PEP_ID=MMETSP1167-20130531/5676_1 /TAXON_ID=2988 /ORGANISM="Mallomonas Sp, Strain CCMP3275" /LENGTH=310 /DNA_ID=CAMNT_0024596983 /DNA_START=129 /DNA_END=1061 /DNA_ORIENTATION=-
MSTNNISLKDKYLFDLNGYVVVRNVFSAEEVSEINVGIDKRASEAKARSQKELRNTKENTPLAGAGVGEFRKDLGRILEWGEDSAHFRKFLNHPKLVPYFHEFIGPGYRMDHHPFLIIQEKGSEGFALHGGTCDVVSGGYNPHLAYTCFNGHIHNQLLAASIALVDHNAGDGGLCVVRGSHKSNFAVPPDMIDGIDSEFLYQPVTRAGDVILFSEGTVHGAKAWTADHQRRVALFRFSPATVSYGRSYYPSWPQEMLSELTEGQKAVLEPPYATRLDRPIQGSSADEVTVLSRSDPKKAFDKEVFKTGYF